ncbi:MAG: hypothetical protein JWO78_18 [Micavibrio sp.]|nr:hypothetical protein [Micavibrio sp.]
MIKRFLLPAMALFFLSACAAVTTAPPRLPDNAPVTYTSTAESCVPYARRISGFQLYGDAYSWWDSAKPKYMCGQTPQVGAAFILARTGKMPEGHVAIVTGVTDSRHITVTHSNWGDNRGRRKVLYHAMPVEDISLNNDWTRVKFWNYEKNVYGFPYAAKGFIYK